MKNKPVLLTIAGCIGFGVTIYNAITETRNCLNVLDSLSENKSTADKVITVAVNYKKTIISASITLAAIIGSCISATKTIAGLTAGVSYLVANRSNLTNYLKENGFDKKLIAEAGLKTWTPSQTVEETGKGNTLCFDGYSGRWFYSSEEAVREDMKRFANRFEEGEHVNLNDMYTELGIHTSDFGESWGYVPNSDIYSIRFREDADDESGVGDYSVWVQNDFEGTKTKVVVITLFTEPMNLYGDINEMFVHGGIKNVY